MIDDKSTPPSQRFDRIHNGEEFRIGAYYIRSYTRWKSGYIIPTGAAHMLAASRFWCKGDELTFECPGQVPKHVKQKLLRRLRLIFKENLSLYQQPFCEPEDVSEEPRELAPCFPSCMKGTSHELDIRSGSG